MLKIITTDGVIQEIISNNMYYDIESIVGGMPQSQPMISDQKSVVFYKHNRLQKVDNRRNINILASLLTGKKVQGNAVIVKIK